MTDPRRKKIQRIKVEEIAPHTFEATVEAVEVDKPYHACFMARTCCRCGQAFGTTLHTITYDRESNPHLVHQVPSQCAKPNQEVTYS